MAPGETYSEVVAADVLVIGSGPAGIAAAACAAEAGLQVVMVDRWLEPGGQIWRHLVGGAVPPMAQRWLSRLRASGARVMRGTSVVDIRTDAGGFEALADASSRPIRIWAARIVLATGGREFLIPFDGWTLSGVMGIGGAQALLKSGTSFAGKRVAIAGSGPLMLPVAASLSRSGAKVVIVAEQASKSAVMRFAGGLWRTPSVLMQAARYRAEFIASSYSTGTWVTAAHGTGHLESVSVTDGRRTWRENVDVLCTGYGLIPNIELARLLGCDTRNGAAVVDSEQQTTVANVFAVGETTGIGGVELSLVEGEIAGRLLGSRKPLAGQLRRRAQLIVNARRMLDVFYPREELRSLPGASTIICRCEDVSYGAVQDAACSRQAKLYTRAGMGPCQGRTCMPGLEFLLGWQSDTVRPPVEPTPVSVLSSEIADHATPPFHFNSTVGEAYQ